MYTFESTIRYSEVDYRSKLNPFEVINYFQDCSTFQSEGLGGGVDVLHQKNLTWVITNWNIQIKRYPSLGEHITIGTFPWKFRECFGMRNYFIKDDAGEMIAMADSLWTLIDYEKGNIVKIDENIRNIYDVEEPLPMDYAKGRIKMPSETVEKPPVTIMYQHMDANMHVNNAQYINFALNNMDIKDYEHIRVEYRKQVYLNDVLTPLIGQNDKGIVVLLRNQDGENVNIMEFS